MSAQVKKLAIPKLEVCRLEPSVTFMLTRQNTSSCTRGITNVQTSFSVLPTIMAMPTNCQRECTYARVDDCLIRRLQTESRLSKLLLLKGYADLAPQLRQYSSRVVSIPDLFRTTKIPASQPQSFSAVVSSATKSMTGTKGTKKQTAANTAIPMSIAASSVADSPSEADSASLAGDLAQLQIELESIVEGAIDEVQVFEWNQLVSGTGNKASGVKGKKGKVNQEDEWIEANAKNKKKDKVKKDKTVKAGGDDEWDTIKGDSGKKKNGKKNAGGKTVRGLDPRPCHA